jgi:CBS domain-containing protein
MRRPVVTAKLDDTIADAVSRMASSGIHSLPVISEDNDLLGIVTTTDIMQALLHGGQDERLHTRLVKEVDQLSQPGQEISLPIPL